MTVPVVSVLKIEMSICGAGMRHISQLLCSLIAACPTRTVLLRKLIDYFSNLC